MQRRINFKTVPVAHAKLTCASIISAHIEWILICMIDCPCSERQANLPEIIDAIYLLGTGFVIRTISLPPHIEKCSESQKQYDERTDYNASHSQERQTLQKKGPKLYEIRLRLSRNVLIVKSSER